MDDRQGNILIIDDSKSVLESLKIFLDDHFENVTTIGNPNQIPGLIRNADYDVILLDMNFGTGRNTGNEGFFWLKEILHLDPAAVVILITAYSDVELAVRAIKEGAVDFVAKPWENNKLLATLRSAYHLRRSKLEIKKLRQSQRHLIESITRDFIMVKGSSASMKKILDTVDKVALTDANVLVTGENGTGKELIAREIHYKSNRRNEIFMRVDLGSLAESLIESELFGHVKGAFTDAKEDRTGKLEAASGGTLFLDEIGNLSLSSQSKILSILQHRTVTPLGSNKNIPVDIRLISATNRGLPTMIEEGLFREDLYYRINTIHIEIPPLRERKEDIPELAGHFFRYFKDKYNKPGLRISGQTMKQLADYGWPGNVRELQHSVEKAVILASSEVLVPADFIPEKTESFTTMDPGNPLTLENVEKQAIIHAIRHSRGNLSQAAKILQIGRQTLYNKMKKYNI